MKLLISVLFVAIATNSLLFADIDIVYKQNVSQAKHCIVSVPSGQQGPDWEYLGYADVKTKISTDLTTGKQTMEVECYGYGNNPCRANSGVCSEGVINQQQSEFENDFLNGSSSGAYSENISCENELFSIIGYWNLQGDLLISTYTVIEL